MEERKTRFHTSGAEQIQLRFSRRSDSGEISRGNSDPPLFTVALTSAFVQWPLLTERSATLPGALSTLVESVSFLSLKIS